MQSQANLLVITGSKTTITALFGTAYYLCYNPSAQPKLALEIRGAFDSYDKVTSLERGTTISKSRDRGRATNLSADSDGPP